MSGEGRRVVHQIISFIHFGHFFRALFWTDWDGHNPRIEGCSMSGEGRRVVHQIIPAEGGGWPNGLTVDYDFKRLYWIDARYVHSYNDVSL